MIFFGTSFFQDSFGSLISVVLRSVNQVNFPSIVFVRWSPEILEVLGCAPHGPARAKSESQHTHSPPPIAPDPHDSVSAFRKG